VSFALRRQEEAKAPKKMAFKLWHELKCRY